jgi:DNA-binding transcriptional LysR family regulator
MKPFCYHPFDLRQLVSFAEIARTGSFRQAAKTLHIAQPALSRQIKQLEAALGISLFDRTPRRLRLTIEGRELAERLPALFSQIDHLAETVKGAGTGGTAQLRIGDSGALTTEVIAPALRRLREHWPNLRLSSVQNTSEGFFQDLLENRIDCALPALEPKSVDLASHKLCSDSDVLELAIIHLQQLSPLPVALTNQSVGGPQPMEKRNRHRSSIFGSQVSGGLGDLAERFTGFHRMPGRRITFCLTFHAISPIRRLLDGHPARTSALAC